VGGRGGRAIRDGAAHNQVRDRDSGESIALMGRCSITGRIGRSYQERSLGEQIVIWCSSFRAPPEQLRPAVRAKEEKDSGGLWTAEKLSLCGGDSQEKLD